ncbi:MULTISPECIES: DUF6069 family protein [unclassified Streptomyces]|uniref:DUF6069 family protein n=1 Tax=unclassified Streptomyces TaxID=2593676 RepID=UPI00070A6967|nr:MULTISPECIES: DUF6069 family protein [unclassified Streptomyces]KRD13191.1 hypothetical protein ASE41_27565 [Streptomyces sp. Root264]
MVTANPSREGESGASGIRRARILAVVAGAVAALVVWLVGAQLAGVHLDVHSGSDRHEQSVGAAAVLTASVAAGLAAWGSLAALERWAPARAHRTWTVLALTVLVLSLAGPFGLGVTAGAKAVLVCLHLVPGSVLVIALRRTAARA